MNRRWVHIAAILGVVLLLNVVAHCVVLRYDLTDDKRYSLKAPMKELLGQLDDELTVTIYLSGELNSGFVRLRTAVRDFVEEMDVYAPVESRNGDAEEAEQMGLTPTIIHEREQGGRMAQTMVYPYVRLDYKGRSTIVPLLRSNRSLSGEENLNQSIENLEYMMAEAIVGLTRTETQRIAFLEGHGELPEENVYDISAALSRYFQIDRGVIGDDATVLDDYAAVIVADPQLPFSESDKYVLDRYVQRGGNILWVVNGVQFSQQVLSAAGFTPVIALDLHLTDLFFRYGVRINPGLVVDLQCLSVPVDVSRDPEQPNYQPVPWTYAPLLLTSQYSPITRGVGQINSLFVSPIDAVGGEDGLKKQILLASSSASKVIGVPAEVDLMDLNVDVESFTASYVPVAVSVEGQFPSLFEHRMVPEEIANAGAASAERNEQASSRQVWIAAGSVIRNEWQQGQALPVGYDRYTRVQFANRDLLVNAVLWMTDKSGLIALRDRVVSLRLLNDKRAHDERMKCQIVSTVVPVVVLLLVGGICVATRRLRYAKKKTV